MSYQGELIENFSIRFENGKAVEVHAEKGEELLKHMISMDETAGYLGEVALVPYDSPINQTGILFLNTLYDENAACHLALGMGFTNLIEGYENYSQEELYKMGINDFSTLRMEEKTTCIMYLTARRCAVFMSVKPVEADFWI